MNRTLQEKMKINKSKTLIILAATLIFAFSFIIYLITLAPGIVFGDSADLIMSAHFWGVPHPPGYPLFTILAKIFSFLPLKNIAFRVNLLTALIASTAALLNFFIVMAIIPKEQETINKVLPAASASLLFAFSYTFWSHSIITEFVSLEILLLSGLILLSLKWVENKKVAYLYALSFLYGLAVSNRPTTLFFAPAFLYIIASIEPKIFTNTKRILISLTLGFLGLLPYLYLPISAARNPLRNWGDVRTWNNFWNHLTAAEYRSHFQFFPAATIADQITAYIPLLLRQFTPAILAIALIGIFWTAKQKPKNLLYLFFLFLLNFAYAINVYQISELILYLPGFLILAFLIGLGLNFIITSAKSISSPLFFSTAFLIALLPMILIGKNFSILKNRNACFAKDYTQNVLNSLDRNALLVFDGDNLFPIEYFHLVERKRPDVALVSKSSLRKDWYLKQLKRTAPHLKIPSRQKTLEATLRKLVSENIKDHPIYTNNISPELLPLFSHEYEGMVFRLQQGKGEILIEKTTYRYPYSISRTAIREPDYFSLLALWQPELNLLSSYLVKKEPEKAISIARELQKIFPQSALFNFELGEVYRALGENTKALQAYKLSIKQDPLFGDSYSGLAAIYLQEKDYVKALDYLEKAAIHQPKNPALRYYLAQIYEKVGWKAKAIKNWEILLKLDAYPAAKKEAQGHLQKLRGD